MTLLNAIIGITLNVNIILSIQEKPKINVNLYEIV